MQPYSTYPTPTTTSPFAASSSSALPHTLHRRHTILSVSNVVAQSYAPTGDAYPEVTYREASPLASAHQQDMLHPSS
ncbi:hypothetical protein HK104_010169, partial [Borealophlyctis nickersoniae]